MRLSKTALLLLTVPVAIWAADPFLGTWKANVSKSHYTAGSPPKEQTVVIGDSGDTQDTTVTVTAADGTSVSYRFTTPSKGGPGAVVESAGFDGVTAKRINENTRQTQYTMAGKVVGTVQSTVSSDGRSMRAIVKGTDADGQPINATVVYEQK
jgi:hypothetical protein